MSSSIKIKNILLSLLIILLTSNVFAVIPDGYYNAAQNKTGTDLKKALHNIIKNHTTWSYAQLWDILSNTDEDPKNPNNIIELYIGRSQSKSEHGGNVNQWNREHVWAKSHGDFGEVPPAGTDAHHLRPADVSVNSARGNKDFDEGGTPNSEATECKSTANTWEPRNAVKGDIARMMFYMVVRYEGDVAGEPDLELVDYVTGEGTKEPKFGKLSTLLKWNKQDTVDAFERRRNDVVYSYQKNRNPFVDHPEWADKVFGTSSEIKENEEIAFKFYPNPANECIKFENTDKIEKVLIYNLRGVLLIEKKDLTNGIDISSLSTGMYIMEVLGKNNNKTIKKIYKK